MEKASNFVVAAHKLPKVSILIASFNRLPALKRAIKSALQQDYSAKEIVIIDDGSEKESQVFLERLASLSKFINVYFQKNQGPAAARASGVEKSTGDFICILDSDDVLRKNAVSSVMHIFLNNEDMELVHVNNRKIFKNKIMGVSRYPQKENQSRFVRHIFLSPIVPFKHSGMTFRRKTMISLGNYDVQLARKVDIDIFLRFLTNGKKIKLLEDPPLVDFIQNTGSISRSRIIGIRCWFKIIDKYEQRIIFRTLYKSLRTGSELGKMLVEMIRYKNN
ncbi:MAG: glycosyltransferase family 2 protein [Calditrichaeota bacterium]|nr:MAG: glycosyltransferase family 2 protein [Calditrichota bacterium]